MDKENKIIEVVCGIICNEEEKILLTRRKKGKALAGKWEFPGGKTEAGESRRAALKRELKEELGMQVKVEEFIAENTHHNPKLSIQLIAF